MILFFFFNDTATTEIYTLSLHDALPIFRNWTVCCCLACSSVSSQNGWPASVVGTREAARAVAARRGNLLRARSEEHTSELQSRQYLVCRLLLEKKKTLFSSHSTRTPHAI